ncbi:MAG: DUF2269 domain-containing protein [Pseudomonadota bacterium]
MPELVDIVHYAHVMGATVLLGTGAGIAFFMLLAHRTQDAKLIAHVSGTVVIADTVFTATAAIFQPVTGAFLAVYHGWPFLEGWVLASILLYLFVGLFWIPVIFIQIKMRNLARIAAEAGEVLPNPYHRLFRIWFIFGFPAFFAMLAIFWLMLFKPDVPIVLFG